MLKQYERIDKYKNLGIYEEIDMISQGGTGRLFVLKLGTGKVFHSVTEAYTAIDKAQIAADLRDRRLSL